jgi:hypothetical protein
MLTCMDDLTAPLVAADGGAGDGGEAAAAGGEHPERVAARPHVVVIGATNRPDALDSALRCVACTVWSTCVLCATRVFCLCCVVSPPSDG